MGELCRTLYVAGHVPTLSSEEKGEKTCDPGCGLPRQKVPCLASTYFMTWWRWRTFHASTPSNGVDCHSLLTAEIKFLPAQTHYFFYGLKYYLHSARCIHTRNNECNLLKHVHGE